MVDRKRRRAERHNVVDDPFKELARGLATTDDESVWEEKPVGIQEFVESDKFLDLGWDGRIGCRPKIMEILKELEKPHIREAILLLGKGSGKDYLSSILHLHGIYLCLCMISPQRYHGLSPNSKIYFINTARNDIQAKKVFFEEFKGMLMGCPWFEDKFDEPSSNSVSFNKRLEAMSVNSQAFGWLGFNTLRWVGDELAFFLENDKDEEGSESRAGECWQAAFGSCTTRGNFNEHYKMVGITTPRFDDDFVMHKFEELKDRDDGYTIQAATWDIHPNRTKEDFKHELVRDYRRAMRDFGAVPSGVIESFWHDPDFVENNVCETCRQCPVYAKRDLSKSIYDCWDYDDCRANAYKGNGEWRDWFHPDPDKTYAIHFDLSKNKDRVGFSLTHIMDYIQVELDAYQMKDIAEKEGVKIITLDDDDRFQEKPVIKVDAIGHISPSSERDPKLTKNGEIYFTGILNHIVVALIDRGFNIEIITFDQYQSHHMKQSIEDFGIETELISLDRNDVLPVQAKLILTEHRAEYPYNKILCEEAKYLKYVQGKKVDHMKKKGKDVWDGFAGSITDCENYMGNALTWVSTGDDEDDDY